MPNAIHDLNTRIYSKWFPTTGYERAYEFDLEVYPPGDPDDELKIRWRWIIITGLERILEKCRRSNPALV
ncbi:MAG: hypothetical protein FH749_12650 [Firmicutes bacterium]|nr:hypothetical protein [Bacillota bacterium]